MLVNHHNVQTDRQTDAVGLWDMRGKAVCNVWRSPTVMCPEHSSLTPSVSHICPVIHSSCSHHHTHLDTQVYINLLPAGTKKQDVVSGSRCAETGGGWVGWSCGWQSHVTYTRKKERKKEDIYYWSSNTKHSIYLPHNLLKDELLPLQLQSRWAEFQRKHHVTMNNNNNIQIYSNVINNLLIAFKQELS